VSLNSVDSNSKGSVIGLENFFLKESQRFPRNRHISAALSKVESKESFPEMVIYLASIFDVRQLVPYGPNVL